MSPLSPTWSPSASAPFHLIVDGVRATDAWRASKARERRVGLLGTDDLLGALWIERCSSVHTFGMRYALDIAFLDHAGQVLATTTMAQSRLCRARLRARSVLEVPAGRLRDLHIVPGASLSLVHRAS